MKMYQILNLYTKLRLSFSEAVLTHIFFSTKVTLLRSDYSALLRRSITFVERIKIAILASEKLNLKILRKSNLTFKKYYLGLFFLNTLPSFAQSTKGITGIRDTSYSMTSAYLGTLKTHPNAKMVSEIMPKTIEAKKNVVYAKIGERALLLDAFYPKKKNKKLFPAIIIIHGGGWRTGNKNQHNALAQRLADLGYVCFLPEYRLSTEALFPAAVHDLKASIRWARANAKIYQVDTNKIATLGFSAGGQLSALLGSTAHLPDFEGSEGNQNHSSKVNAVIDIDGILAFIHPESGEGDDSKRTSAATNWFGFSKTEKPQLWEQGSALTHAGKNTPPTLFLNSAVDRMHAGRTDYLAKLYAFHIYTEIHNFPDSPHGFCLFEPWFTPTVQYVDAFLKKVFIK
jgi:pectinesterase